MTMVTMIEIHSMKISGSDRKISPGNSSRRWPSICDRVGNYPHRPRAKTGIFPQAVER